MCTTRKAIKHLKVDCAEIYTSEGEGMDGHSENTFFYVFGFVHSGLGFVKKGISENPH